MKLTGYVVDSGVDDNIQSALVALVRCDFGDGEGFGHDWGERGFAVVVWVVVV